MENSASLFTKTNVIFGVGLLIFVYVFRNSNKIFTWIENQTLGTRNYIQEKFDLLFIEAEDDHITYVLLSLSIGLALVTLTLFGLMGNWGMGVFFAIILSFI